jgi:hypothetical protein
LLHDRSGDGRSNRHQSRHRHANPLFATDASRRSLLHG